jgi:site-specific recombinase XerD
LKEFGKIKTFRDFTYDNIVEFDLHLKKTIKSSPVLYKRHGMMKRYINEAIKRKMCEYNPYDDFKVKRGKYNDPTFLEDFEIKMILDYTPEAEKIQHAKDLFIVQMFTGVSCCDIEGLDKQIFEMNGRDVYRSSRNKTDNSFVGLLFPQVKEVFAKYNYDLPLLSNQKYNDYLKLLAAGAGIKKNLTTHVGRHTFATYIINKGIPIESVSKAMGHSNIKQTQRYAHILGKKVIDDMSKLLE